MSIILFFSVVPDADPGVRVYRRLQVAHDEGAGRRHVRPLRRIRRRLTPHSDGQRLRLPL